VLAPASVRGHVCAPLRTGTGAVEGTVRDHEVDGEVVVVARDGGHHLGSEADPDPYRPARQRREQAVVVAAALTEATTVGIEGDPGDEHRIDDGRVDRRADGFPDAPVAQLQGPQIGCRDEFEPVPTHAREHGPGPSLVQRGDHGTDVGLLGQRGVQQHHLGVTEFRKAGQPLDDGLRGGGALARAQRTPGSERRDTKGGLAVQLHAHLGSSRSVAGPVGRVLLELGRGYVRPSEAGRRPG
jgi:hypothetical protein